jgi:hypothetical protein
VGKESGRGERSVVRGERREGEASWSGRTEKESLEPLTAGKEVWSVAMKGAKSGFWKKSCIGKEQSIWISWV